MELDGGKNPIPLISAMEAALREAKKAPAHGDVPVGAVVFYQGKIIASRHNERELQNNPAAHAEMLAITDAASELDSWRLSSCSLVVTLEPCPMCAGAAWAARIAEVIYGAADPKAGACGSLYNLGTDARLNHEFEVAGGILEEECIELIAGFFKSLRSKS